MAYFRCSSGGGGVSNFKVEKITNLPSTGVSIQVDFVPRFVLLECNATYGSSNITGWQMLELWYTHATRKEIGYWNNQGNTAAGYISYSNGVVNVKTYGPNWDTNTSTVYIVGEQ